MSKPKNLIQHSKEIEKTCMIGIYCKPTDSKPKNIFSMEYFKELVKKDKGLVIYSVNINPFPF